MPSNLDTIKKIKKLIEKKIANKISGYYLLRDLLTNSMKSDWLSKICPALVGMFITILTAVVQKSANGKILTLITKQKYNTFEFFNN